MASEAITAGCGTGTGCGTRFAMGRAARWNCWPGCGFAPGPLKGACFGAQLSPRAVGSSFVDCRSCWAFGGLYDSVAGELKEVKVGGFRVQGCMAHCKRQVAEDGTEHRTLLTS